MAPDRPELYRIVFAVVDERLESQDAQHGYIESRREQVRLQEDTWNTSGLQENVFW